MFRIRIYKNHRGDIVRQVKKWEGDKLLLSFYLIRKKLHGKFRDYENNVQKYFYYGQEVTSDFKELEGVTEIFESFCSWMALREALRKDVKSVDHGFETVRDNYLVPQPV